MTWLAENALPIWMAGAIALTMVLVVFFQTRENKTLVVAGVIIAITAALLAVEKYLETPREAVGRTLYELAATVEANDVAGAMKFLASTADSELRDDVQNLMPLVRIERARIMGSPDIDVADGPDPASAVVECRGIIIAVNKKDGMKGGADDTLHMNWVRAGDRWLLEGYKSKKDWQRELGQVRKK